MNDSFLREELAEYRRRMVDGISELALVQARGIIDETDIQSDILGGLASIDEEIAVVGADVARLVAMADLALPTIMAHLSRSAGFLRSFESIMAAPRATGAAERYRNGCNALGKAWEAPSPDQARRWYSLAERELRKSADIHPFHALTWFELGMAQENQGLTIEAADSFSEGAFFGVVEDETLNLAATSVMLAAACYHRAGRDDKSEQILEEYLVQLDRCAEVHLELAANHNRPGQLRKALALAPHLAADAQSAEIPGTEEEAAHLCRHADGPVQRLQRLERAIQTLVDAVDLPSLGIAEPTWKVVELPPPGVDALLLSHTAWPFALAMANRLIERVEAGFAAERGFREKLARAKAEAQDKGQREDHHARANIFRLERMAITAAKQAAKKPAGAEHGPTHLDNLLASIPPPVRVTKMPQAAKQELAHLKSLLASIPPPVRRVTPFE